MQQPGIPGCPRFRPRLHHGIMAETAARKAVTAMGEAMKARMRPVLMAVLLAAILIAFDVVPGEGSCRAMGA